MKNIYKTIKKAVIGMALLSSTVASAQTYSDVNFWVGNGKDSAIAVVDFLEDTPSAYSWGIRFNDSITGSEILDLIDNADDRFKAEKGAFLSSIEFKNHKSDKDGFFWGTWSKTDADWFSNTGLGYKIGKGNLFGFSFTDFNPAIKPSSTPEGATAPPVSFDGIDFWVGAGSDSAVAIVDFLGNNIAYKWGVRFDDSITGSQILDLISWNDKDFFVSKGDFLNSITYNTNKSDKDGFFWGTWSKTNGDWFLNSGLSEKINNGNAFGFSYTNFNPAVQPSANTIATTQTFFSIDNSISKDSSILELYPSSVLAFNRGLKDISDPEGGKVTHGDSTDVLGAINNSVLSLGDKGSITLGFGDNVIIDGPGADFAVFENSFSTDFLELAFVEVSSDGVKFVRLPAISITQTATQTGGFGSTDAKNIHNLAGKYKANLGTPFDLSDIKDNTSVDINKIKAIRIVDVVGSIDETFGTKDSKGNLINEPYPTAFNSGGFDLDGIGVINYTLLSPTYSIQNQDELSIYPTQASDIVTISTTENIESVSVTNSGTGTTTEMNVNDNKVNVSALNSGLYIINVKTTEGTYSQKIVRL